MPYLHKIADLVELTWENNLNLVFRKNGENLKKTLKNSRLFQILFF